SDERTALDRLLQQPDLETLVAWDAYLGERFAECAQALIQQAPEVDFIGSHGQTLWHAPSTTVQGRSVRNTLQIAQPDVIFARTGIPVVGDFRTRDMALGGQGAPLVPVVDWLLLHHPSEARATLNIGGIANLTILPAGSTPEAIWAFDTGPGNTLLDSVVQTLTEGRLTYDPNGSLAEAGQVHPTLLERLLSVEYLQLPPPKSTGREQFNLHLLDRLYPAWRSLSLEDLSTTLAEYTAQTIAEALKRWVLSDVPIQRLIASGGGVHHRFLWGRLRDLLPPSITLHTSAEFGIDPDYKEAVAFAVLADCYLLGEPVSFPTSTGVSRPARLGKLCVG
ncbi:MAG: anhydro-N-acetylmuramic acid kinase, partial [Fimbriimonadales bacterium]